MTSQKLIILGPGVFGEEVKDIIDDCEGLEAVGFAENLDQDKVPGLLHGLPVLWVDDLVSLAPECRAVCAIGTTRRSRFVEQVEKLGLDFTTVRHPTARVSRTSRLGEGTILSVGNIVAAHTVLGRHVIVNRGCLIGHHTEIGDYVTVSPGANIGGRVRIGDRCYIGMGATILNDITVGEGSIIGAGSVVTRDVPARVQVLGIPARVTKEDVDPL